MSDNQFETKQMQKFLHPLNLTTDEQSHIVAVVGRLEANLTDFQDTVKAVREELGATSEESTLEALERAFRMLDLKARQLEIPIVRAALWLNGRIEARKAQKAAREARHG